MKKSIAHRLLMLLSAWLLFIGLACISQAQPPSLGFPPGMFQNRASEGIGGCVVPNLTNNWGWWAAINSYTETSGTPTTLITADGTQIGSQIDLGGSGNHLYAGGAGVLGPIYKTNIVNSLPSARYLAASLTEMLATGTPSGNSFSMFVVANETAYNTVGDGLITSNDAGLNPRWALFNDGGGPNIKAFNGGDGASAAFSQNTYHLIAATIDNTGSFPTTIQVDNNSNVAANTAGGGGLGTQFRVGAFFNRYWTGDILEIIFNLAIQPSNTGAGLCNRQYLNSRYNLGLGI